MKTKTEHYLFYFLLNGTLVEWWVLEVEEQAPCDEECGGRCHHQAAKDDILLAMITAEGGPPNPPMTTRLPRPMQLGPKK